MELKEFIKQMRIVSASNRFAARSLGNLCTPRQHASIRIAAEKRGLNAAEESLTRFGCNYEYLTKSAANKLLRELAA